MGRLLAQLSSAPAGLTSFDPAAEVSPCVAETPNFVFGAFDIAQEVHRGLAERFIPGALPHHSIVARKPAPVIGLPEDKAVFIYADDSHHVSLLAEEANAMVP